MVNKTKKLSKSKSIKKIKPKSIKKIKPKSIKKIKPKSKKSSETNTKPKEIDNPIDITKNYKDNTKYSYVNLNNTSILCPKVERVYKKNIGIAVNENAVDDAKKYILKCCDGDDYSLYFTSGEIESNRIILCCAVNAYRKIRKIKPHVIISSTEHCSITKYANSLHDSGQIELSIIKPNSYGCILSHTVADIVKPNTCLVLITYINQDLGSVNNIEKISNILHEKKVPIHSDCTYLFGKHKLNLKKTNIDSVTISFDIIGGPIGLGALIVSNKFLLGYKLDEHSTTLENKNPFNIPAIMAATEAVKISMNNRKLKNDKMLKFRNDIITQMGSKFQTLTFANFMKSDDPPLEDSTKPKNKLIILGPPIDNNSYYTPSILSLVILGSKKKTASIIQSELKKKGIIIGIPDLSKNNIYDEIGMPEDAQPYIIRISLSDNITQPDINKFIKTIKGII
jgi:cysteine sulfinate desulfinase/cysteine desulfurase-like protein